MENNDPIPRNALELAEMIADREGLSGARRDRFISRLEVATEKSVTELRRPSVLSAGLCAATPLIVIGLYAFSIHSLPPLWMTGLSVVMACLAIRSSLKQGRNHSQFERFSAEWKGYCQHMRPLILENEPGLLDRNLPDMHHAPSSPPESMTVTNNTHGFLANVRNSGIILIPLLFISLFIGLSGTVAAFSFHFFESTPAVIPWLLISPSIMAVPLWIILCWRDSRRARLAE